MSDDPRRPDDADTPSVPEGDDEGSASTAVPARRRRRGRHGWPVRLLGALVATGLGVGAVQAADRLGPSADLTQPGDQRRPATTDTRVLTRSELLCPGPERGGSQQVGLFTASLPAELMARRPAAEGSTVAVRLPRGGGAAPSIVQERGRAARTTLTGSSAVQLVGIGGMAPGLTGLQATADTGATTRGLSATPCQVAAATSYLVGGGAAPARQERVVLVNPAPNPVSVRLDVLGSSRSQQVVVPGHSRSVTPLGEIDDTRTAPIVRVRVERGAVAAFLTDVHNEGTTPRGSATTPAITDPSDDQVVPVVAATGGSTAVRVGAPGTEEAVVRVQVIGTREEDALPDEVTTVPAGGTATVNLPRLPAGRYAVRISSDVPVVAAAESRTPTPRPTTPSDLMWVPAAQAVERLAGTSVPRLPGVSAELVVTSLSRGRTVTVGQTDDSGSTTTRRLNVPANGVARLDVSSSAAVWVRTGQGPVHAGLMLQGKDAKGPWLDGLALAPVPESARVQSAAAAD